MGRYVSRAEMDAVSAELYEVLPVQYRDTFAAEVMASPQNADIFRATLSFMPSMVEDLFKQVQYTPGTEWPLWKLVAAFYIVERRIGPSTVRKAGERIYSTMPWPPQVKSLADALRFVETAYFESHLRFPKDRAGEWLVESEKSGSMTLVDATAYPCNVNEGVISGICLAFAKQKPTYRILRPETAKRGGGLRTHYEIAFQPVG